MSNNVAVQQPRSLDEFADWTDEVESRNEEISERAIIGQSVRFANDGKWRLRDNSELTKSLIVANCRRVLTKWGKEKRPVETIFLKAGEKFPTWRSATKKRRSPSGSKASTTSPKARGRRSTSSTWSIPSVSINTPIRRRQSAAALPFVN